MADVPHFAVPFRVTAGKVATVEQGSKTPPSPPTPVRSRRPALKVPIVGDYMVQVSAFMAGLAAYDGFMSYDVGASGAANASDSDGIRANQAGAGSMGSIISAPRRKTISTANHLFYMKYKWNTGTIIYSNRCLIVKPIKLG